MSTHTPRKVYVDDAWLLSVLGHASPRVRRAVQNAEEHRLQILVSAFDRPLVGHAEMVEHAHDRAWPMLFAARRPHQPPPSRSTARFRCDAEYFYPASTIKLSAAIVALRTVQSLAAINPAITVRTPLAIHPCFTDQSLEDHDPTNTDGGTLCVEHEIRKTVIVSDNPSFNRLYTIAGHRELNETLWNMGLKSTRINHRLADPRSREDHRKTGEVEFKLFSGTTLRLPARTSDLIIDNADQPGLLIGKQHKDADKLLDGPMNFHWRNRTSLEDLHNLLAMVLLPDLHDLPGSTGLSEQHRLLLCRAMWPLPRQSENPKYDPRNFPDIYVKYALPGVRRLVNDEDIAIFSKVGQAYGFTIENALITDRKTGRGFMLSATIYSNSSGVIGADSYDYATVSIPFMADLAEALARELL
ncbi:MAG: serine hydrolase [Phycisphaerales bacterium]|nr:serine hydrolase [Phycisphaerales bacterium]